MRDNNIGNFSYTEKPVNNEFTRRGKYALISKTTDKNLADCKVKANLTTYATILKYDDSRIDLDYFASKSNGRMQVIETKKLETL